MYGGDGTSEGFEETKKKRGKKHANDDAIEQMDEMRAMLEKLTAERDAALLAAAGGSEETKVDEATVRAQKKAKLAADKKKKKAEKLAKKKAEAAAALKKQQDELARQQEELQMKMAAEMEEEDDSDDEAFDSDYDSDAEEVVFNGYEYNGIMYHHDEDSGELSTEDGDLFGYIDEDGEVHEGEKPEDE